MDISIIIVSYNTADLLFNCLVSLQATHGVNKEVFVVDNCSTDNSAQMVAQRFQDVGLIINSENRGFGAANNQALKNCRGRYIFFLNPDTVVKSDSLKKAVAFMDKNQIVGLAGTKLLNTDGTLQESVFYKYPSEKFSTGETLGLKGKIAWVKGACMIAREQLINSLKGFDEDFFLYGEEQDLAWRIREKGFHIGYIEDAEVFHWGAQSERTTAPPRLFAKHIQAEFLFYKKHYMPSTINRIKKTQKIKAYYRLITLKIQLLFSKNKEPLKN